MACSSINLCRLPSQLLSLQFFRAWTTLLPPSFLPLHHVFVGHSGTGIIVQHTVYPFAPTVLLANANCNECWSGWALASGYTINTGPSRQLLSDILLLSWVKESLKLCSAWLAPSCTPLAHRRGRCWGGLTQSLESGPGGGQLSWSVHQLSFTHATRASSPAWPIRGVRPAQHSPLASTQLQGQPRPPPGAWLLVITWATDMNTDPGCGRVMGPDISMASGMRGAGLSHQAECLRHCIPSCASLHSAQMAPFSFSPLSTTCLLILVVLPALHAEASGHLPAAHTTRWWEGLETLLIWQNHLQKVCFSKYHG